MKRAPLILLSLAGLTAAASAQEVMRISYSWLEVVGATTVPVTSPNSIIDPGEGARMSLHVQALINGTSAIGQTTFYTPPPPPGFGTVRGIASIIYNLRGDNGAATAAGVWGTLSISSVLSAGAFGPRILLDGALIDSLGGGQFVAPGGTANGSNPIDNAFRGVWQPASYAARTVHWVAEPGTAAPTGQHNGILVAYGITQPDPNDPTTWYDNLLTKYIGSDFGAGLNIPIAPSPSTAALFAISICAVCRRRRTRVGEACL